MGARQKLNTAYFNGGLMLAAVVGFAANSWWVFFLVLTFTMAASIYSGNIRPASSRSQRR